MCGNQRGIRARHNREKRTAVRESVTRRVCRLIEISGDHQRVILLFVDGHTVTDDPHHVDTGGGRAHRVDRCLIADAARLEPYLFDVIEFVVWLRNNASTVIGTQNESLYIRCRRDVKLIGISCDHQRVVLLFVDGHIAADDPHDVDVYGVVTQMKKPFILRYLVNQQK